MVEDGIERLSADPTQEHDRLPWASDRGRPRLCAPPPWLSRRS